MADLTTLSHWINGSAVASQSGRYAPVYNPALGAQTKQVPLANADEIAATIRAAHEAFPAWRDLSISRRQSIISRFRELLHERAPALAAIITSEHGKVISDAAGQVQRGRAVL